MDSARRTDADARARYAEADDAELVARLDRDPAAVEEFYRRHVRGVTRYADRRLNGAPAAADVVAATFLAAIESAAGYDPGRGEPAAWLYGIANNTIAAHRRRQGAEARATARMAGRRELPVEEATLVEARVDAARRVGPVSGILATLPPAERQLLELVLHQEFTVREAADELGLRPGTARMRLARIRARLATMLDGDR